MPDENDPIGRTLMRNRRLDFVRRVLDPQKYPRLPLPQYGPDVYGTHQMGWTTLDDGRHIVYPNIVYDNRSKALRLLGGREAVDYALSTGEYIPFEDAEAADYFSKHYKRGR